MSESSESSGNKRRDRSASEPKQQASKLFITNIDGKGDIAEIENELRKLFEKYGTISSLVAKRNRNSEYCFAFVEMKDHASAAECVKAYLFSYTAMIKAIWEGNKSKFNSKMTPREEKIATRAATIVGKWATLPESATPAELEESGGRDYRRRSRSESEDSYRRHKKSKRRRRSDSSDRGRSRSPKSKKEKKGRDEKKKKKHHRRSYSSDSR